MKRLNYLFTLLVTTLLLVPSLGMAQPSNTGFENWTNNPNNNDPVNWITTDMINLSYQGQPVQLNSETVTERTTNVGQGNSSARLQVVTSNLPINVAGAIQQNVAFSQKPDSFSFMHRQNIAGSDTALILFQLTKWNSSTNSSNVVANGFKMITNTSSNWISDTVDYDYLNNNLTPDSLTILVNSDESGNGIYSGTLGTWIEVDALNHNIGSNPSTCQDPSNLSVSNTTSTSTNVNWVSNANGNQWILEYGPSGFNLGNGNFWGAFGNPGTSITGLSPNTTYDVYVREICGPGDTSNFVGPITFSTSGSGTSCSADNVPYSESFSSTFPQCWNRSSSSEVVMSNSCGNNFTYTLQLNGASGAYAITNYYDVGNLSSIKLAYDYRQGSASCGDDPEAGEDIDLDYWNGTQWVNLVNYDGGTAPSTFTRDSFNVNVGQLDSTRFRFYVNNGSGLSFDNWNFDDLTVTSLNNSCPAPSNLQVSNITSSSAQINWNTGDSADLGYIVTYGSSGFNQGSGTTVNVQNTNTTISNLSGGVAYDVYVQELCTNGDTSWYAGPVSFNTGLPNDFCSNATSLPCDTTISGSTVNASQNTSLSFCGTSIGGPGVWYKFTGTGDSVAIDLCNSNYDTKLHVFEGSCGNLTCVDGNDDFCSLQSQVNFSSQNGVNYYVYVNGYSGATGPFTLNIDCIGPPSCPQPTALNVSNVTSSSAQINWNSGDSADLGYTVSYGPTGFNQGSGTTINTSNTNTSISNLTAGQSYDAYVREICNNGDTSSYAGPVTFTTPCTNALATLPYTQGFSSTFPQCWNRSSSSEVVMSNTCGNNFTYTLQLNGAPGAYAITNYYDVGNLSTVKLAYDYRQGSASCGDDPEAGEDIDVDYWNGTQWVNLVNYDGGTAPSTFTRDSFNVNVGQLDSTRFRFYVNNGTGSSYDNWNFDNFEVTTQGNISCPSPNNLQVSNVTSSSAQINWNTGDSADLGYMVSYGPTGFNQASGTTINTTTTNINLSNLNNGTTYDVYVQELCTNGDTSWYAGPVSFNTGLPNDFCSNAISLPCDTTVSGSTDNASQNTSLSFCGTSIGGPGVWYKFTGTGDSVAIDLCNSNYDTKLHVFEGSCGNLTCVDGNDDFCSLQSQVNFSSQNGVNYYVYVNGYSGATGPFTLNIDCIGPPSCPQPTALNVSNVTSSSAQINWNSGDSADLGYTVSYGPTGFNQGSGTTNNTSNTNTSIGNLTAGQSYDAYVREICTNGDTSSYAGPVTFTTPCTNALTTLPYTQGFSSTFPQCWNRSNSSEVVMSNTCGNNFTYTLQLNGAPGAYAITNYYDVGNLSTVKLAYDYRQGSASCGDDPEAGEDIDVDYWNGTQWVHLVNYDGGTAPSTFTRDSFNVNVGQLDSTRFRFYVNNGTGSSYDNWNFDNFEVTTPANISCPAPVNLQVSNVTSSSAQINWNTGDSADLGYMVSYGPTGFNQGSGTTINVSNSSTTLSNLNTASGYDVYVQEICANGDTSNYTGPVSFSTPCNPFTAPYSQHFDATIAPNLDPCWSIYEVGYDELSGTRTATTNDANITPPSTPNLFELNDGTTTMLISPQFSDLSNYQNKVRFKASDEDPSGNELLHVGVMTDPNNPATFTAIDTVNPPNGLFQEFQVDLNNSSLIGNADHVALRHAQAPQGGNYEIFIDDFNYEPISCPQPQNIAVNNVTSNSAQVSWSTGDSADLGYIVTYGPNGFNQASGTTINSQNTNVNLNNLNPSAAYDVYVQEVCTNGDTSGYAGPEGFITPGSGCNITADAGNDQTVNYGDTVNLSASGGNSYSWSNGVNSQSINVVAQDTQDYVVTVTVGNCTDKDTVTVFTRPRPKLTYLTDTMYNGVSGVNPEVGTDDQYFEYRVKYQHPNNIPPRQGYPIVGIDMNGDGDFTGSMDMQVSMNELDPTDNNYADGKIYTFTRGFAPNQDLNYSFLAYDVLESPAKGNAVQLQSGPRVVDDSLDLHLYANDISFSNNNPEPGENVTITATINNSSSFPASQTQVHFYQEGTLLAQKSISALAPNSEDTVSITESFANPEYYPIKVVIDENNLIPESNELNNFAIRPLVVGDFATAGAINVSSNLASSNPCVGGFSLLKGTANYANNVSTNAEVAGAEVKVTIQETGDVFKGYTDQNGNFRVWINAPSSVGSYTVNAQITDFSIVGSTTNHVFTTSNCPSSNPVTNGFTSSGSGSWCNCASPGGNNIDTTQTTDVYNPDLVVQSYHISPSEINPDPNEYIQLYSSFENRGDISADSFSVRFLVDGNQIGSPVMVPVLGPGLDGTVQATDSFSTSQNGFHEIRVVVDSTDQVAESNETNNAATRGLIVGDQTDLGFLEPNGLTLSNPSPSKGATVDLIATLKNYGGASGNGTLTFYYVNGPDTTTLGSNTISIGAQDTTTSSIQWVADTSVGQLYASISNTNQDVNPQNNDAIYNLDFPEPSFIKVPEDTSLCGGNTVTLTVEANNAQSYQWQFEGNDIPNATDSFLVLNNLSLSDSGDYRCIVSNSFKADTSISATVAVSPLANADFSYQQNQFTVSFSHNAQHYNSIEWKFGDGSSSTDPNPSHTYSGNGTHDACLIASNSCHTDTTCQSISISVTVPDTIKGQVDESGNPLDEGDVSLWEVNGGDYTKVDSIELQASDNGEFNFGAVSAGSYVVKSSPASSAQLNNIVPTYHQDKVFWQNATQITTNDNGQVHTAPISLQTGTPLANGPGSIVGNISEAGSGKQLGPGDPQGGVEVLLMKTNDDPLDYTYSDANGDYGFNNLPVDSYKVHVEITGFNADDRIVVISTNDPSDTADFDVDPDQDTVINNGIKREYERLPFTYEQYPNPAKDELNLQFTTEQRQEVEVTILNSLGKRVKFESINLKSGKNEHSLDVQSLGSGVYFLQLRSSEEDGMVETEKLIISR